jgi:formylglycine-generating enzyme required for sulfatase activity
MKGQSEMTMWRVGMICAVAALLLTGTVPVQAEQKPPKLGATFKDCKQCPQMMVIPAGTFMMGSKSGTRDERPVHHVTVRRFAMGKYEVTFAQWDVCVAAGGCGHRPGNEGWGRGNRPVINVSWKDAKQYVAWLSRKTGKRYRLPSEAEWEYAARAGSRTRYWWGNAIGRRNANCSSCGSRWDKKSTAPVGSFQPNRFGLYDVHGNVLEWVEDCQHGTYAGAPSNGRPWTNGGNCPHLVLRGGSYYLNPKNLRSASRSWDDAGGRSSDTGFRVARTLP